MWLIIKFLIVFTIYLKVYLLHIMFILSYFLNISRQFYLSKLNREIHFYYRVSNAQTTKISLNRYFNRSLLLKF